MVFKIILNEHVNSSVFFYFLFISQEKCSLLNLFVKFFFRILRLIWVFDALYFDSWDIVKCDLFIIKSHTPSFKLISLTAVFFCANELVLIGIPPKHRLRNMSNVLPFQYHLFFLLNFLNNRHFIILLLFLFVNMFITSIARSVNVKYVTLKYKNHFFFWVLICTLIIWMSCTWLGTFI